ncbi:MAG: response regulator transcription factor [Cyanobacteria bacterium HKST-UBA02]|nr:response regulator transcription factor [Cyanobacteria bacterium HKST-UBA02]
MAKILVVEDDRLLLDLVDEWLTDQHHLVETADNGRQAFELLCTFEYDIVLLDWDLPELSGIEILKAFRERGGATPVLMLTKKGSIDEKEAGFDSGTDDYLTKPFDLKELSARVGALLRRPAALVPPVIRLGNLELDPVRHRVSKDGEEVSLLPREFALLEFLMKHPGQVFSPAALIERVWESDAEVTDEAVSVTVRRLRKKIDAEGKASAIGTVYGVGYRFDS